MPDSIKLLQEALTDLEQAQKLSERLSDKPANTKIREQLETLINDVKQELDRLRKEAE
jgi:hypothetical protein